MADVLLLEEQAPPPDMSEKDQIFRNLAILPPRQKQESSSAGVWLPPLRADEPVQSLRVALTEIVGFAQLTNYRYELEDPQSGRSSASELPIVSIFTGKNAEICIPVQIKDAQAKGLDDFGDLSTLLSQGLQDGSSFRIVLQRYDAATVKDHVNRLRSLFEGNVPTASSLVDVKDEPKQTNDNTEESSERKESHIRDQKVEKTILPNLKCYDVAEGKSVAVEGTNLADFFYLACGEQYEEYHGGVKPKKKRKGKNGGHTKIEDHGDETRFVRETMSRWNETEELCRIDCAIQHSCFHPPPAQRRYMGDIAYFVATFGCHTLQVTSTTLGFYINRSQDNSFDPSPAKDPHFSHSLLDCLLSVSPELRKAWSSALEAAKERAELLTTLSRTPYTSLFRNAQRVDFDGFVSLAHATQKARETLDASLLSPSWLVPCPRSQFIEGGSWTGHELQPNNFYRVNDDLQNTFGIDIRNGASRDWNEELQSAREMPTESLQERLERARHIHKVMTEFGEASLLGVKAISEGHILPMNPNESTRSQVYLHNNIFFSRGVDVGPETFKIAKGDRAARKAANRDVQCVGTFHRMEKSGLYTLATVVIDYLGTRFICQSILPGILVGEKSHKLLYGSVENCAPIKWDAEFHKILEDKIGMGMRIATRPVFIKPLTIERLEELEESRKITSLSENPERTKREAKAKESVNDNATIDTCAPIEAKGVLGSDNRKYILDFSRLTPRDANWVPKAKGGTGNLENTSRMIDGHNSLIPLSLDDDEWAMNVLRPEIVTRFTQMCLAKRLQAKAQMDVGQNLDGTSCAHAKDSADSIEIRDKGGEMVEEKNEGKGNETSESNTKLSKEDLHYLANLKYNINVFLPYMRSFKGINDKFAAQQTSDELLCQEVAQFLWGDALPRVTKILKDGSMHQIPIDGKTLTEFLHRNGINCRYMGRLAVLAREEEEKDTQAEEALKQKKRTVLERKLMPKCWLELLECEMVARAAKHVLDDYLSENGDLAARQPLQTIASFLCALVSESEESAAQTETRMGRASHLPDEDDLGAMTISGVGGGGDAVLATIRCRQEIWHDIEIEVGRRFRYTLSLYNTGNKSKRALYIPLLRRICQRSGIRLFARNFEIESGKCFCGGSFTYCGRIAPTFPISPLDIADIVPLMKHSAAYSEGFTTCLVGGSPGPALQISLADAIASFERAHIQSSEHHLSKGLELAQDAAALYQRVTDCATHPGVIESLELMATIFLEGGDLENAVIHGGKALALSIQSSGFDSATSYNAHMTLFQILFASRHMDQAVKHIRAAIYLLELMAGPRHSELYTSYHRLGTTFSNEGYNDNYLAQSLAYFEEAKKRDVSDRLLDGVTSSSIASILVKSEKYKEALDSEMKAFHILSLFLGKEHQMTIDSENALLKITKMSVAKNNVKEELAKDREESAKAEAIAADLAAEEERKQKKTSSVIKKKKKGKK